MLIAEQTISHIIAETNTRDMGYPAAISAKMRAAVWMNANRVFLATMRSTMIAKLRNHPHKGLAVGAIKSQTKIAENIAIPIDWFLM